MHDYHMANSDGPPCYKCDKFVTFEIQPLLATGDQPNQNEAHIAIIQCAEAIGGRAWWLDNG